EGIRYDLVTGVQTCALPIWAAMAWSSKASFLRLFAASGTTKAAAQTSDQATSSPLACAAATCRAYGPARRLRARRRHSRRRPYRSEARRVGKECRTLMLRDQ